MSAAQAITLLELNERIASAVRSVPGLSNVWVVAETSDVRCSGGHCYLELIDKDSETGVQRARARANIWSSVYRQLSAAFVNRTGIAFASDIKVMVCVNVTFHPVYGFSLNIININPEYTVGDLLRRRREMIERLTAAGIINNNKQLQWPEVPWRIAIISAPGAAGYGDFINQLFTNHANLRFTARLYPAVMQGERTPESILNALRQISFANEEYDCVVIIRGGGATGDLIAFDNYDLAVAIAMYELPVIIGIGHERDITLLDYVANMRVKTPTAAAAWLIDRGMAALDKLGRIGSAILDAASATINRSHRKLENMAGQIPVLAAAAIARERQRLGERLDDDLQRTLATIVSRQHDRLNALSRLAESLSPEATLRRGFSITRCNGVPVTSSTQVPSGSTIVTTLADGSISSVTQT